MNDQDLNVGGGLILVIGISTLVTRVSIYDTAYPVLADFS